MRLRENCDAGDPTANFTGQDQLAADLTAVAENLQARVSAASSQRPTISVK